MMHVEWHSKKNISNEENINFEEYHKDSKRLKDAHKDSYKLTRTHRDSHKLDNEYGLWKNTFSTEQKWMEEPSGDPVFKS